MAEAPASAAPAEAEAPVGPRFFFIRHGEGEHNALIAAGHKAEGRGVLDPKLTEAGRAQAAALGASLRAAGDAFELVITSPLSRALETSRIAFAELSPPPRQWFVTPLHTESGIVEEGSDIAGQQCQKGRSPAALAADFGDELFDWSVLGEPESGDSTSWTEVEPTGFAHPQPANDRLELFRGFLHSLGSRLPPGAKVAVVGHSGFFRKFLQVEMKNCELVEMAI